MHNYFIIILVSICFTEFVHNVLEIWGMRQKVEWLRLSLNNEKHGNWPIRIDTKTKTIILHTIMFSAATGVGFLILKLLNLQENNLVITGLIILIVNYIYTTVFVDKYHSEIGIILRKIKKENI